MQALNDESDGVDHLSGGGHSMNMYPKKCILVVCFSTDNEHFNFYLMSLN